MVKYIKDKEHLGERDNWVKRFKLDGQFDPKLVQIPDEFKDLQYSEGDEISGFGRKARGRKIINERTNKSLAQYDAWRCSDRLLHQADGKQQGVAKMMIAPSDLIKIFGMPDTTETFFQGTGQYTFEDNNLDMFCLFVYKKTDFYHGMNREDEFYTS